MRFSATATHLPKLAALLVFVLCGALRVPVVGAQSMQDYALAPPLSLEAAVQPMIMLTLSADHQFFLKAYNDYDDLTGNGLPDTTYNRNFEYVGYFDHQRCYNYDEDDGVFKPTTNQPVAGGSVGMAGVTLAQYCSADEWSGNFLNWATMTRIDMVRHVLYGGYRSTDTETQTILERSYLPNDGHSFAKYIEGPDVHLLTGYSSDPEGYTFCNTTLHPAGVISQNVTAPPVMRAVRGNYSLWANSERFQCLLGGPPGDQEYREYGAGAFGVNFNNSDLTGMNARPTNPSVSDLLDNFVVRVEVCSDNISGAHLCKRYPEGNTKPIGLLQEYGESGLVDFGLITRSFNRNKSFGVLRKNVGAINDEINPDDGTFLNPGESIVGTMNALRLLDYSFDPGGEPANWNLVGTYNANCQWHQSGFNEGQCRNWGNPFSKIMAESYRYFAGAPNANVTEDDVGLSGLNVATWRDPLDGLSDVSCVNFNVIGFNASVISYDTDGDFPAQTPVMLEIGNDPRSLVALTNIIGQTELEVNQEYFVGGVAGNIDGQCTPKRISELGQVVGTCPDAPRLQGSYLMAGLAHHVKTHDVRPDIEEKVFNINTFGVTLAGNLPTITMPVGEGGATIEIVPACRNIHSSDQHSSCALVNFVPVYDDANPNDIPTNYYVSWEDSEQGGDYDQDLNGMIRVVVNGVGSVTVSTSILQNSTNQHMQFGYIISGTGTDQDGLYMTHEINRDQQGVSSPAVAEWSSTTFQINLPEQQGVAAKFLESPLHYAAKWGSFTPRGGSDGTDFDPSRDDWADADGNPKNYAQVRDPARLRAQLQRVLDNLIASASTGTGAAITANTLTGEGLMLQSLYHPLYTGINGNSISWTGTLNGLFIDRFGNLREDSNGNRSLTDADHIVQFTYVPGGEGTETTRFNRYEFDPNQPNGIGEQVGDSDLPLNQLNTLWSARDQLAEVNVAANRDSYEASADTGRYIVTARPPVNPGASMLTGGTVAFTPNEEDILPLLNAGENAGDVIRFIRGAEIEGFRSRTVNWGNGPQVWRLGDMVHSTPAIVGRPSAGYDTIYGDDTYATFRNQYRNRRQMVYVGANDGKLHAFNAGFFDSGSFTFNLRAENETAHPLGSELWAYVPYNLLPHLKWLTSPDYSHVYYVDGEVQTFDVNIFPPSEIHPNGWGTILVVGMRFGGGEYTLGTGEDARTFRSGYVIMDVTDPEQAPTLLAEVTHQNMGYTLAGAELVKRRTPAESGSYANPGENEWHLVFGSGPTGNRATQGISGQPPHLFSVNLRDLVVSGPTASLQNLGAGSDNGFVGGIKAKDWNENYQNDMLYFGLVGDSAADATFKGALMHANLFDSDAASIVSSPSRLLAGNGTNLPFSVAPMTVRDRANNYWVFAGTGRFLVKEDLELRDQNKYFGVKANNPDYGDANFPNAPRWLPGGSDSVEIESLHNVSYDRVYVNDLGGTLVQPYGQDGAAIGEPLSVDAYREYVEDRDHGRGWYRDIVQTNFTKSAFHADTVIFNAYVPGLDLCQQAGFSNQYMLDMSTGLPQFNLASPLVGDGSTIEQGGEVYQEVGASRQIDGMASSPVVINNQVYSQDERSRVDVGDATPRPSPPARRGWREISSDELQ